MLYYFWIVRVIRSIKIFVAYAVEKGLIVSEPNTIHENKTLKAARQLAYQMKHIDNPDYLKIIAKKPAKLLTWHIMRLAQNMDTIRELEAKPT